MTELTLGWYEMPAAGLGPDNPLPPLTILPNTSGSGIHFDDTISSSDRKYFGDGGYRSILPYQMQDAYDRVKKPRSFRVAVLENEILKATFLLELGGRLWSLYHKPARRELLHVNPVFQPANLAVRNAWFAGGVEWNAAIMGHSPLTCSPIFAARLKDKNDTPVLRLFEWDRLSGVPIQIDCYLPPQASFLFVRVRLVNPHPREIPMYWWSNVAVPEQEGGRILVAADSAFRHTYRDEWYRASVPMDQGVDLTRPGNFRSAADIYYYIPDGHRPWITALDAGGRGLIHASTARLKGRKLFVWGMQPGSRHWQEFLSVPGKPYLEIQAGLARTQREYLPMPAGESWSWLEAYGLIETNPLIVHGANWTAAWTEVQSRLDRILPQEWLEVEHRRVEGLAHQAPLDILHRGSGWGALERHRREAAGEHPFHDAALVFDDESLGPEQAPWLKLLEEERLPCPAPDPAPSSWMVQSDWQRLLEKSLRRKGGTHWYAWLHLGMMQFHAGDMKAAQQSWENSLRRTQSAWALRNLAVLARQQNRLSEAVELLFRALALQPATAALAAETCEALLASHRAQETLDLLKNLPANVQCHGRLRFLGVRAALIANRLEQADNGLRGLDVPDIREGEVSLSELWFELKEKQLAAREGCPINDALRQRVRSEYPPPSGLDFRMTSESP